MGNFGQSRNAIPGTGAIHGEIRSFNESKMQEQWEDFIDHIETVAKIFNVKTKIYSAIDNPSYVFGKNDPYVQKIARVISRQGIQPDFVKSWSVSDANIFNTNKLQVVNIGDGFRINDEPADW